MDNKCQVRAENKALPGKHTLEGTPACVSTAGVLGKYYTRDYSRRFCKFSSALAPSGRRAANLISATYTVRLTYSDDAMQQGIARS